MALCVSIPDFSRNSHEEPLLPIELNCQIIDESKTDQGFPRVPVRIPTVYINAESCTIYFDGSIYNSTLELVVPGTDTIAYSYSIPDGETTVSLPAWLEGEYELHIHRGNYCFMGIIEL